MVLSLFFFVDETVDVLSVASVRRGSATRWLLRHIQGFGVPWREGRWTWMDSSGRELPGFKKMVEAPGCVFNYLVHQGVSCKYAGLYCMPA